MNLLLYSYTLDVIRCGDSVSNKSFWKSRQQRSQQPVKEKTWQRVEDSVFHTLLRTELGPGQELPGGRLQLR